MSVQSDSHNSNKKCVAFCAKHGRMTNTNGVGKWSKGVHNQDVVDELGVVPTERMQKN